MSPDSTAGCFRNRRLSADPSRRRRCRAASATDDESEPPLISMPVRSPRLSLRATLRRMLIAHPRGAESDVVVLCDRAYGASPMVIRTRADPSARAVRPGG